MTRLWGDLRFAWRGLRRSPVFTLVAVASLALGIGANTAIFTLIDQLMLRLLPVQDPEQLVMIWTTGPHMGNNRGSRAASYPMYQDFQQKSPAFSYVFCRYGNPLSVTFAGQTERVNGEMVSGNFFAALGVGAAVGHIFRPDEDDRVYKGHPVAVLSHDYWVSRFGGDRGVLGKQLTVNNYTMTVVGVAAAGFHGLDPARGPQIWVPIQMKPLLTPGWDDLGNRRSQWIQVFARLKHGYTLESAQASLQPLLSQILQDEVQRPELRESTQYYRERFLKRQVKLESAANGYSQTRRSYATALIVLMCMVGLVLLIACFNVANLLIARAASRQKEIAVRLAVGASRSQLILQLLSESVLLATAGGALGIVLSNLIIRGLLSFVAVDDNRLLLSPTPDVRVLGFAIALAMLTSLLFGLAPALQAMKFDLWTTLKDVVGAVAGAAGSVRMRRALVTAQVAFSFLLLAGAGLFVKTLANLKQTNSGFRDIDNLISFQMDPALNGYDNTRVKQFYKRVLENLGSVPAVTSVSYATVPLLAGNEWDSTMSVEGHTAQDGEDMQAFMNSVSSNYWKTMGVHLIAGRDFDQRDEGTASPKVAIVNRKFAQHYFGNQSPIGRHVGFGGGPKTKLEIEIVGMVEDTLYEGPREGVRRQVFIPDLQGRFPASAAFYVRAGVDSKTLFTAVRRRIAELDGSMPVYGMKTLENQLDQTLATERLIATLSASFGVLATLLAAIGVYGVTAFMVARRTKEIGLRMALGAGQGSVVWLVLREALALLGIGVAVAVPCAYGLSRYLSGQLFGVQPADGVTALASLAILAGVAAGAGWLPAQRASAIDPIQALRYE